MGTCSVCSEEVADDQMEDHKKTKHAEGGEAAPSGDGGGESKPEGDAPAAEDKPAEGGGGDAPK